MGIGAFQSALQFGMFLNPMLVVWLEKTVTGSRAAAVGGLGLAALVLAALAILGGLRHGRR